MAWFLHSCHTARLEMVRGGAVLQVLWLLHLFAHCSVHHRAPKVQKILYCYIEDYVRPSSKDS